MNIVDGTHYAGMFQIDGRDIGGDLTFSSSETRLELRHSEFFRPNRVSDRCILGTLSNLTRVSLFECLLPATTSVSWKHKLGKIESAKVIPHFIIYGSRHLTPLERRVKVINVILRDAAVVFTDFQAFSTAYLVKPSDLRALLKDQNKRSGVNTKIGKHPIVAYYTGADSIFRVRTHIGTISAEHMPGGSSGNANGVSIKNSINLKIAFPRLVTFTEALGALRNVLPFFEILTARRQEMESLSISVKQGKQASENLDVYWCNPPRRERRERGDPHSFDLPIDATRQPREFEKVLKNWLERHSEWKAARDRFSVSFCKENYFDIDRLVGSANMFDLLPEFAKPQSVHLDKDIIAARDAAQRLFKPLPDSAERGGILSALGRLGRPSLKHIVRHRANMVLRSNVIELPHFLVVLDLAVDARNHFVHGSAAPIDYILHFFKTAVFFTKALEFVFVVSDLLEAGWDFRQWYEQGSTLSHPLADFAMNYRTYLASLIEVLPNNHKLKNAK